MVCYQVSKGSDGVTGVYGFIVSLNVVPMICLKYCVSGKRNVFSKNKQIPVFKTENCIKGRTRQQKEELEFAWNVSVSSGLL